MSIPEYPPEWDEEDEDLTEEEVHALLRLIGLEIVDEEVLADEAAEEKAWQDAECAYETMLQKRGEG